MPAISAPATVLVTGASGFLATFCCQSLLRRGFNVRGTVRSQAKGEYLKKLFGNESNGKFEYVIVENMQAPNAFDEAVKSVDAVEHVASPLTGFEGEPEQALKPAIDGTIGILESVKKNGLEVKRVVITSSSGALSEMKDTSWNQAAVDAVEKQGRAAPDIVKYCASKVLAERAAWDFVEKHKNNIEWDVVTICPSWLVGPNIQEGGISASNMYLLSTVDPSNRKTGAELTIRGESCCDVRDIADIHAELLMAPGAGGERIVATLAPFSWKDVYNALSVPYETPSEEPTPLWVADHSKLERILGKSASELFRPFPATIQDAAKSARERGWDLKLN
ncbi:methylglyoxal reductase (NADPH-dependent) gre2 [Tulasnella sp. JGI-2019a]|nr:methylglyoxal reductase (NADPH-dependent) gre2 [Tulasnella sp. JGI-2019a]